MHSRLPYAFSSSGDAYSDRQLIPNFELWVKIFCVLTCFYVRITKPVLAVCPSVRQYPEKRKRPGFVNISPTQVPNWYINGKVFTSTSYSMETQKFDIFLKKFLKMSFDLWLRAEINMEDPKNWIKKKIRKWILPCFWRAEIALTSSISVLH